jgi:sugar phosphate permease
MSAVHSFWRVRREEYRLVITRQSVQARASGVFFGWYIVGAAGFIQLLQNGLLMQAYGTYVPVLRAEFGWSSTALAAAFSLQRVESGLLGPLQGWMLDRWGPRAVITVGMIIFGTGFMAFSQINSLLTFYLAFLFMAVGASLSGFMSLTTTIVNWFERRRSIAISMTQVGMSVGGLAVPIVAWALIAFGWRTTSFMSGVIILVVGLPLAQIMRHKPEQYGYLPDGDSAEERDRLDAIRAEASGGTYERFDFTARQAMKTRAFWFIGFGHALAVLVVSAVMVHLVVHLTEGLNFTLRGAATVVAFMTAITMMGQIAGGFLGDRFNKRIICTIAMFGHAGGLLALAYGGSLFWVIAFALLHGTAWGMRGPLMQSIRADYFGRSSFGQIMGFSSMITMFGMMSGPIIAGVLADRLGSYQVGFTVLAIMAACGSVFFIFGTKPTPPAEKRRQKRLAAEGAG